VRRCRGVQYDDRMSSRRLINLAGLLACAGLLAYAYFYVELYRGLEPCPLCMFQRVGLVLLGAVFLMAALHDPKGWGARVYAVLLGLASLLTVGIAARHLYVQHLPPGVVPSCGAPLDYMMKIMPITQVIAKVLNGSGECAVVNWQFLGLAMPAWVLIWALALGVLGVLGNLVRALPVQRLHRTSEA
jgi:disulfide bond formation protein DsbB